MKRRKGYSLVEIMIVISIMNILGSIAIALYTDYTKKARTAEVPLMLRALVLRIDEYLQDAEPKSKGKCELVGSNGRCQDNFPKNAALIGFVTNNGTAFGNFFEFKVKSPHPQGCSPQRLDRYAYAVPIVKSDAPANYQFACMNERFDLFHGSQANNPGGGKPDDPGGGKPDDPGGGKPDDPGGGKPDDNPGKGKP